MKIISLENTYLTNRISKIKLCREKFYISDRDEMCKKIHSFYLNILLDIFYIWIKKLNISNPELKKTYHVLYKTKLLSFCKTKIYN